MKALQRLFGLRVLATLDNDEAIDGTLESGAEGWLVFTGATIFPAPGTPGGGEPIALDGTQFVAAGRVMRLQVP